MASLSVCDVMLKLAPALQVDILIHWLQLQDVARMDSALCSYKQREAFLKILDEEYCVFCNVTRDVNGRHLPWVVLRNLKISAVDLTQRVPGVELLQLFQMTGKYLRQLSCNSMSGYNMTNFVWDVSTMCPNLEKLVFSLFDLSSVDLCSFLSHQRHLQHLDLSQCSNLTGDMIVHINSHAKHLRVLDLSGCQLMKSAFTTQIFHENNTIHTLYMGCMQVSMCFPFIFQCKAVRTLCLSGIKLTDVYAILTECPALTTLSAGVESTQSNRISEEELQTLISLIHNLNVLHLYHGRYFRWQDGQLERLINSAPKLWALYTARIRGNTVETITESIAAVNRLRKECYYSANHNTVDNYEHPLHTLLIDDISAAELTHILELCPNLCSLSVVGYGMVNNESTALDLMTIIGGSSIKLLHLSECDSIVSGDLIHLRNLLSLSLDLCTELKHTDLVKLLRQNPNLRKLSLIGCAYLTEKSILYIVQQCKFLEELTFDNINTGENYHTYMRGSVNGQNTELLEGLIRLQYPNIQLSLQLLPELV